MDPATRAEHLEQQLMREDPRLGMWYQAATLENARAARRTATSNAVVLLVSLVVFGLSTHSEIGELGLWNLDGSTRLTVWLFLAMIVVGPALLVLAIGNAIERARWMRLVAAIKTTLAGDAVELEPIVRGARLVNRDLNAR
jgi:hypothetical protein